MLEVIFTNDKPASSMVKVVAMHEDKPIKQEIELYKKYRKADSEVKLTIQKILEYTEKYCYP